jgi:N-acetyl-anhydromuramyl-L-alanine amidase AmpD
MGRWLVFARRSSCSLAFFAIADHASESRSSCKMLIAERSSARFNFGDFPMPPPAALKVAAPKPVKVSVVIKNKLLPNDAVSPTATLEILPSGGVGAALVTATTGKWGSATLTTTTVADGSYVLRVTPATSASEVGPDIAEAGVTPARMYRSLDIAITLVKGKIDKASVFPASTSGTVVLGNDPRLTINLQPIWMESPNRSARPSGTNADLIIVHHTGGPKIGPALNQFLTGTGTGRTSAHYVIDVDGQIVKMVKDSQASWHAGPSFWAGRDGLNDTTIGIEVVHQSGAYPDVQYTALIGLLERLVAAYPSIKKHRIIGHADISKDASKTHLGGKASDPGLEFDWKQLEDKGLGLLPKAAGASAAMYGGFFQHFPKESLRKDDADATHMYGGKKRAAPSATPIPPPAPSPSPTPAPVIVTGEPIKELQQDLKDIGYWVDVNGKFDDKTFWAVKIFQEHFFSGSRKAATPDGKVNKETAERIKAVR